MSKNKQRYALVINNQGTKFVLNDKCGKLQYFIMKWLGFPIIKYK